MIRTHSRTHKLFPKKKKKVRGAAEDGVHAKRLVAAPPANQLASSNTKSEA